MYFKSFFPYSNTRILICIPFINNHYWGFIYVRQNTKACEEIQLSIGIYYLLWCPGSSFPERYLANFIVMMSRSLLFAHGYLFLLNVSV